MTSKILALARVKYSSISQSYTKREFRVGRLKRYSYSYVNNSNSIFAYLKLYIMLVKLVAKITKKEEES